MDITPQQRQLFQRLDRNGDGLRVNELKQLDTDQNGELSSAEAEAAELSNPEDINTVNTALQRAQAQGADDMAPVELLFPSAETPTESIEPLEATEVDEREGVRHGDQLSGDSFDLRDPNLAHRMVNLRSRFAGDGAGIFSNYQFESLDTDSGRVDGSLDLNNTQVQGINSFDDLRAATRDSVRAHLGAGASDAEIDAYIQANGEQLALQLGSDLSDQYSDFTNVGLTNDVDLFDPFRPASEDPVVCTNIHGAVAAFRREVLGQEAYISVTNGNDGAHITTVYQEGGKWHIQNYGNRVQTDADNLRELYANYMPDQRTIMLGEVSEDGMDIVRHTRTELGEQEYRFRSQIGAGGHTPGLNPDGIRLGNDEITADFGQWNLGFDPQRGQLALNRYTQSREGNSLTTSGFGIEAQDHQNDVGFRRQRIDAKYDSERVTHEQLSETHEQSTRRYANFHVGFEDSSWNSPLSWGPSDDPSSAIRFGGLYDIHQNNLFGDDEGFRFELGYGFQGGATATLATGDSSLPFWQMYGTRMLSDLTVAGDLSTGFRYDNGPLTVRGGIQNKLDLARIQGINSASQQLDNMHTIHAYGEAALETDRVRVAVMTDADLENPGVVNMGGVVDIMLSDNLSWATSGVAQWDPILGDQFAAQSQLRWNANRWVDISGGVQSNFQSAPMATFGASFHLEPRQ